MPDKTYHFVNIQVSLETDSELARRAEAQAARYGVKLEKLLDMIVQMHLLRHMADNLSIFEEKDVPEAVTGDDPTDPDESPEAEV